MAGMPAWTISQRQGHGVNDVAFHKKRGLPVEDMVKSGWGLIASCATSAPALSRDSCLKRAYGLGTLHLARTRSLQDYIWSAVVAQSGAVPRLKPA